MNSVRSNLIPKANQRLQRWRTWNSVKKSFELVRKAEGFTHNESDVTAIIIGRDSSYFLKENIEHLFSIGVAHIVYVDNLSSDSSIETALSFENITVVVTSAEWSRYQRVIRQLAAKLFVPYGWCLSVDDDEIFSYPNDQELHISTLVKRLDRERATCLCAQMLDMVPEGNVMSWKGEAFRDIRKIYNTFSISNIDKHDYMNNSLVCAPFLKKNKIMCDGLKVLKGGLRRSVFGENPTLTKHSLFKFGKGVASQPHPHVSTGLVCSSSSVLLKHYKFSGNFLQRDIDRVDRSPGKFASAVEEANSRLEKLQSSRNQLVIADQNMMTSLDFQDLTEKGFLANCSEQVPLFVL